MMDIIKNTNSKYENKCGEEGTLPQGQWEYKLV